MAETAERAITPEEIVRIAAFFKKPVEFFYDSNLLVGEGKFSFRAKKSSSVLKDFESRASRWIGAWRTCQRQQGKKNEPFVTTIPLNSHSTYEEAWTAAENIAEKWTLGPFPAETLAEKVEEELDVLVLAVEAPADISGAACWLPDFGTILINRKESEGRRNFDLAHELFHLLTWQVMAPEYIDRDATGAGTRRAQVEKLAQNFAGALLMPGKTVREHYAKRGSQSLYEWLDTMAPLFRVTILALYWRLVAMHIVNREAAVEKVVDAMRWEGRQPPPPFSRRFLAPIAKSVNEGYMSAGFAAELLGETREGMERLFGQYQLQDA